MPQQQGAVDYDALAAQARGQSVDYDALEKQAKQPAAKPTTWGDWLKSQADHILPTMLGLPPNVTTHDVIQSGTGLAKGATKSVLSTAYGGHNMVAPITGDPVITPTMNLQPSNGMQQVGKTATDIGQYFAGPGGMGKAATALVDVAKAYGLGAAQSGGDLSAGVAPAVASAVTHGVASTPLVANIADRLKNSAAGSMIRALGPAGGRGPTGEAGLEQAEKITPQLMRESFMPISQKAAREQAGKTLAVARTDLFDRVLPSAEGQATFNQPKLLANIDKEIDGLKVKGTNVLPQDARASEALLKEIRSDVENLGPTPTNEQVHSLKAKWNKTADYAGADPAAGSKRDMYDRGANLIRTQLGNDAKAISAADEQFTHASRLNELTNAASVRRPTAGMAAAHMYAAKGVGTVLGASEGYREGGVVGGVAGAIGGYQLAKLIQSPGFRYVSANMKQKLATALESGDDKMIQALLPALTAQATAQQKAQQP